MRNYRPFFCSSAQFLPYRSQPMLQNSKELPKKLFKFLKKSYYYIGSCYFVVFYVQNCPFSSFSRLRSPLRALEK